MAKKKVVEKKPNEVFEYEFSELKEKVLQENTIGRAKLKVMRYWCFRFMTEAEFEIKKEVKPERYDRIVEENKGAPAGLKEYIESLPGFGGWDRFGSAWDLRGDNPFFTVYRMLSLWKEWDFIMERVAIPINAPPAEILARVKVLEQEYNEKKYDSTV